MLAIELKMIARGRPESQAFSRMIMRETGFSQAEIVQRMADVPEDRPLEAREPGADGRGQIAVIHPALDQVRLIVADDPAQIAEIPQPRQRRAHVQREKRRRALDALFQGVRRQKRKDGLLMTARIIALQKATEHQLGAADAGRGDDVQDLLRTR